MSRDRAALRRNDLLALADSLGGAHRLVLPRQLGRGVAGSRLGDGVGQSLDFHDYRQYQPGDDVRRVDWRGYARNGQMHVKLFREEVSPLVEIGVDDSASMAAYPGKAAAAVFVAAFVRAAVAAGGGKPVLAAGGTRATGQGVVAALARLDFTGGDSPLARGGGGRPFRLHLGDCLVDDDPDRRLAPLADGALSFAVVMILSSSEIDPAWRGPVRLEEAEDPERRVDTVLDDAAVAAYRARLERHQDNIRLAAARRGGSFHRLVVPDDGLDRADCAALIGGLVSAGLAVTA